MRIWRFDEDHPFTGWHMLAVISAFFGTIIAVNLVMAFAATGSFPGLVVQNSYVASQRYDELLAAARAQDAAGWQSDIGADADVLAFRLTAADGVPVAGLTVTAHVGRPSTTREDRTLALLSVGQGSYRAGTALPPGLWEADIEAWRGDDLVFRRTQEIFIPEERVQ